MNSEYSIVDASMYSLENTTVQVNLSLHRKFIAFFRERGPFIGTLPVVGDLVPAGGGKVW